MFRDPWMSRELTKIEAFAKVWCEDFLDEILEGL